MTKDTNTETETVNQTEEPCTKKAKMDEVVPLAEEAPDNEWPEAWIIDDDVEDQKKPNKLEPNVPVTAADMRALGIR